MTVAELKVVLSSIDPDADVMIEYGTAADEYRTEYIAGVRVVDKELAVIIGMTAL